MNLCVFLYQICESPNIYNFEGWGLPEEYNCPYPWFRRAGLFYNFSDGSSSSSYCNQLLIAIAVRNTLIN